MSPLPAGLFDDGIGHPGNMGHVVIKGTWCRRVGAYELAPLVIN